VAIAHPVPYTSDLESSPNVATEQFEGFRAYVFEYVTGLLWLVTLAVLAGADRSVVVARWTERLYGTQQLSFSGQVVLVAAAVLFGVVVPYCAAAVFKPVSILIVDFLLQLDNRWRRRRKQPFGQPFGSRAFHIVREMLATPDADQIGRAPKIVFLDLHKPALLRRLERDRDELWFRVTSVLPSALLLGIGVSRFVPPLFSLGIGISVSLAVFLIAARQANQDLAAWDESINSAVILVAGLVKGGADSLGSAKPETEVTSATANTVSPELSTEPD
jgi:hypothetical protein